MPRPAESPPEPCVLAFDTSTERMALSVSAAGVHWTEHAAGGAQASLALLPGLLALLRRAGLALHDLQAIAFGQGPGAFTGLRTACAVAQGLGLGLQRPLLPIDSLLVVAEDARLQAAPAADGLDVAVAMDARMDEVYAGRYRWQGGRWSVLDAPRLCAPQALSEAWSGTAVAVLAGSALAAFGARLALPAARRVEHEHDRAGALLRLAVWAQQAGAGVAAHAAWPIYLRDKVALTTAERAAARAPGPTAATAPGQAPAVPAR